MSWNNTHTGGRKVRVPLKASAQDKRLIVFTMLAEVSMALSLEEVEKGMEYKQNQVLWGKLKDQIADISNQLEVMVDRLTVGIGDETIGRYSAHAFNLLQYLEKREDKEFNSVV